MLFRNPNGSLQKQQPGATQLFDQLQGAKVFSSMDLQSAYYQA